MKKLAENIGKLQGKMDPELLTRLGLIAGSTKEKVPKGENTKAKDNYGNSTSEYSGKSGSYGSTVGAKRREYGPLGAYTKKKKKDLYEK